MNGIIHPCFHPENPSSASSPAPATFDDVFRAVFAYVDHLVSIARPRKLLYLALDGVAPRAKMNQQRARRFKSAIAAKDAEVEEKLLRDRFRAEGKELLPPVDGGMEKLSAALQYYVRACLNAHPRWKHLKVILSDANVPGEGEHKIMSFIRAQRSAEGYDPNMRHCLYGLDADLIMLALASHEVHFSILREDVLRENHQPEIHVPVTENNFTSQELQKIKCRSWFPRVTEAKPKGKLPKKPYQFLNIWVLREYLELEMAMPGCKHDIERLIDDFIFICFLMGNDFIPHIPSIQIHESAVDLLIEVYKTTFNKMGGYIVDTDKINDKHAAYVKVSRSYFTRYNVKLQKTNGERKIMTMCSDGPDLMAKLFPPKDSISTCNDDKSDVTENTLELRRILKDNLRTKQDLFKSGSSGHDKIRLGLPGWKSRFFSEKFGADTSNEVGKLQSEMVQKYLEGLCWVLRYYFSDVPSWSWYYPFYYAPFASDVKHLSQFKISFSVDKPLKPFDQLMAVLPPESSFALPKCYSKLMDREESTIQMFYPAELEIDTHGKRFLWQGVAKLPFIDLKLLLSATKTVEKDLALHEMSRNNVGQEKIFLRNTNTLSNNAAFTSMSDCTQKKLLISTSEITGWLSPDEDALSCGLFRSPLKDLPDITFDQTISALFFNPDAAKPVSRLLDNVRVPERTVSDESEIAKRPLWHTYPGPRPPLGSWNPRPPPPMVGSRPETLWKASSPAMMPREEVKPAGTGWRGRGRAAAAAASGSHGRGLYRVDAAQIRFFGGGAGYSFRPGGGGGGGVQQQQQTAWRPVGVWARGGGGRGGTGSGQPRRAW